MLKETIILMMDDAATTLNRKASQAIRDEELKYAETP